jgi:undecaprenyl-diphosphatase
VSLPIAALLGVLQGLTEFLPVSSTAHLLIAERLFHVDDPGHAFEVMIQLGSILAVIWLFRTKVFSVLGGLLSEWSAQRFALMVLVAFLPAMVAGALFHHAIDRVLADPLRVIAATAIGGAVIMLIVERVQPKVLVTQVDDIPIRRAFGVGLCQMLALIPGVSRSGATIVGARVLNLDRATAAEFSFFLAMPTMVAAFVYEAVSMRHYLTPDRGIEIGVGFVMAFVSALFVVRPFIAFITRRGFGPFAWYRIAMGVLLLLALGMGWL